MQRLRDEEGQGASGETEGSSLCLEVSLYEKEGREA